MFSTRLKELRSEKKITQEQLASIIGVERSSIGKYEGKTAVIPSADVLKKLADFFNVSVDYLLGRVEEPNIVPAYFDRSITKIPVFSAVPAGTPIEAISDIVDWEEIPMDWTAGGKMYFGVNVKGDSMYPYYMDGDTVIVLQQPTCESGDDCVVYVNGYEATLKRVKLGSDGSMTLQPLNPEYPPRTYTKEEVKNLPVTVCGVVKELRRMKK